MIEMHDRNQSKTNNNDRRTIDNDRYRSKAIDIDRLQQKSNVNNRFDKDM